MRTIRLEILRHGPPHNQLLSPLTEYLALCENHPAVTVRLGFEHAEFMLRMNQLRDATVSPEKRDLWLEDVARPITTILAQVPGLIRELSFSGSPDASFHLRLILSANELALLPFELANAPQGVAGAGRLLFLQSEMPVAVTREVRRVTAENTAPPAANPKILFAAAAPPEAGIPFEAHLLALRQVIEPWMRHYKADSPRERRDRVAEHLAVLPQASLRQIERACASGEFTHVHILAHGVPLQKGDDRRFGLVLSRTGKSGDMEIVDALRLAKALRPAKWNGTGRFTCPAVVTLAACDAGSVGSVVGAGASIAHALHEEGIPLVIASQFPLSFAGSVIMAKTLYEGFLWVHDPRTLLVNLRRELKAQVPAAHDWASIVAYAAFPAGLEEKLGRARMHQAFRSLEAAMHHADRALAEEQAAPMLPAERDRLNAARNRIEKLIAAPQADTSVYGALASADKRLAQILWRMSTFESGSGPRPGDLAEIRDRLLSSRQRYREAFHMDRSAWALVQALALEPVLSRWNPAAKIAADEWTLARILSERELDSPDAQIRSWAHTNLMELYLLAPLVPALPDALAVQQKAREQLEEFRAVADPNSVEMHATRRQLLRYPDFFSKVNPDISGFDAVKDLATQLAQTLPESPDFA